MSQKYMQACIFISMGPAKYGKIFKERPKRIRVEREASARSMILDQIVKNIKNQWLHLNLQM